MALQINTNQPAVNPQRQVQSTVRAFLRINERLASGLRINRASDDAAGLGIAEALRADVRRFQQEAENLQSGVNTVQTAEGGLSAQADAVHRLRELALQASNGTLTDEQRAALNDEARQLVAEIDATAQNTEFNGTKVLSADQTIAVGVGGSDPITFSQSTAASLGLNGIDLRTQSNSQSAIESINSALDRVNENRANLGAQENRLVSGISVRENAIGNISEAESRIRDADVARLAIERARNEVLLGAGLSAIRRSSIGGEVAARLLGV
jgi:flagellin